MPTQSGNRTATGHRVRGGFGHGLAALLCAVGLAGMFPGVLFFGEEFHLRDLEALDAPMRHMLLSSAHESGWPPLWNEFSGGGQPLAANPHFGTFHPLTWPFFVMPWRWAFSLQVLIPLAATFSGMVFFLGTLRCRMVPAVFGAVAWAFGGFGLSLANLLPMLWTIAPLPWALGYSVRLIDGVNTLHSDAGGWRALLLPAIGAPCLGLSLALGGVFLGGEPLSIVACTVSVLIMSLFRLRRSGLRMAARVAGVALLLAAGLASCVLVPGAVLMSKSVRGPDADRSRSSVWSLPIARLTEITSPPRAQWPDDSEWEASTTHTLYPDQGAPLVGSLYPGFAVAVLAAAGFAMRFRRHFPEAAVVALGAALAVGSSSIVWHLVNAIPLLNIGRFPEKWSVLIVIGWIVAACRTLQHLCATGESERRRLGWAVAAAAAVLAVARIGAEAAAVGGRETGMSSGSLLLIGVGFASVVALLVSATSRHPAVNRWVAVAALLLVVAELHLSGGHLVPTRTPRDDLRPPRFLSPIADRGDAARLFHLASLRSNPQPLPWMAPPPTPALWGIRTIFERDIDSSHLRWARRFHQANLELMALYPRLTTRQLARVGVGSVAKLVDRQAPDPSDFAVTLSTVPQPAARVSCVQTLVRIDSWDEWVAATAAALVGGEDSFAVILREVSEVPDSPGSCILEVKTDSPDRLDLKVEIAGPDAALLQVNQTWDPGWRATIDGSEAPLMRADIAFAALVVPGGRHVVSLKYRDRSISLGVAFSAFSLCALGVWACVLRRRRHGP